MEKESKQELRNSMIRGLARCAELIEKHHPEIAKKIRAKDVPLEEIVSDLEKVVEVHVSRKGITVYIEASKEGGI